MFLGRMAFRLSLLCLAIWTTLFAVATAQTANITSEILNFVPTCAQKCFESFISANFDREICGDSPTLQCLCRQKGNSGYTIGEGAASCLAGESRFGACQGQDGISEATATAYNMCVGVSRAEPRTHSTIVATLVLSPSGKGPLLVPTEIQTATSTEPVATPSATPTSTASLPPGDEPRSTTATPTTSTTSASITPTASTSAEASEDQPKFSSAQIAGITLGCTAVVVFGILLVLLARCIRRKRFGDLESGFSRMRDSMSFRKGGRPGSAPGGFEISSPLPRVQVSRNPADPRWQPSMQQGGVGLAISPLTARGGVMARPSPALASVLAASRPPTPPAKPVPTPAQPVPVSANPVPVPAPTLASPQQKLPKFVLSPAPAPRAPVAGRSPPKPTLTLAIPKAPEQTARVPANARDSVVTEFAEDGEGDVAPGTAIWRPPTSDPLSATTFYFADKGGNWILRNASTRNPGAETSREVSGPPRPAVQEVPAAQVPAAPTEIELPSPDHKTRAERAKEAYGGFSPDALVSPLRLPRKLGNGNGRLGSPIAFQDRRREPQFSSPSLSARLSQTAETITSESSQTRNRPADAYFAAMRESRDLTGGASKRRSAKRASRRISQDSATSIESGFEEDVNENEPQPDLSPVAESPQAISPGKSPVKYPNIRKHNDRAQMSPPLKKTAESDLLPPAHRYNVWHPAGQSSPHGAGSVPKPKTGTPADPRSNNGPTRPWDAPNLKPTAPRNPAQLRTGSPEARAGPVSTIAETQYWQRQRQLANPASYWNQSQPQPARARQQQQQQLHYHHRHSQPQPPPPTPPYELPGENATPASRRYGTPQQSQPRPRPGQQLPTPAATPQPQAQPQAQPPRQHHNQQQQQQQQKQQQQRTPAGGDAPNQGSQLLAKRRGADKAAALTLVGNVRDKARGNGDGEGRERRGGGGGKGWAKEQQQQQHEYGVPAPPITPGWMPELTPTRRGEDLYLDVR